MESIVHWKRNSTGQTGHGIAIPTSAAESFVRNGNDKNDGYSYWIENCFPIETRCPSCHCSCRACLGSICLMNGSNVVHGPSCIATLNKQCKPTGDNPDRDAEMSTIDADDVPG